MAMNMGRAWEKRGREGLLVWQLRRLGLRIAGAWPTRIDTADGSPNDDPHTTDGVRKGNSGARVATRPYTLAVRLVEMQRVIS